MRALVGYDFSEDAEKAIDFIIKNLADRLNYIELIYVIKLDKLIVLTSEEISRFKAEIEDKLKERARDISKYITYCKYIVTYGENVPETINSYAKENKFDLIIVGRRGLNKIEYSLIGSVSGKLLTASSIPLLIVESPHRGRGHDVRS